jgi:hypothetical protein
MTLPPPIQTYFTAKAPADAPAFAAAFAPDAQVQDEGQTHRGPAEICAWWLAAKAKYNHSATPLDLAETEGKTVVRARVSGDFPGSPAVLRFSFTLKGAQITSLGIAA